MSQFDLVSNCLALNNGGWGEKNQNTKCTIEWPWCEQQIFWSGHEKTLTKSDCHFSDPPLMINNGGKNQNTALSSAKDWFSLSRHWQTWRWKHQNGHEQQIFRPGYEKTLANLEVYLKIVVIIKLGKNLEMYLKMRCTPKCGPAWP